MAATLRDLGTLIADASRKRHGRRGLLFRADFAGQPQLSAGVHPVHDRLAAAVACRSQRRSGN